MHEKILEMKNVNKKYGGVNALKNVDFFLNRGEIHCLVGENGSGKSTLIKIISGVVKPDPGAKIIINGEKVKHLNPRKSVEMGIQVIYQDLSLFPNLTVAENIAISDYYRGNIKTVNQKEMYEKAIKAMKKIDISINPRKLVRDLSVAQKQLVAIIRAIATDAKILIMDEPTASLSKHEINELLNLIKSLQKKGITILFVSHKLDEIMSISQRVTILRDGNKIGTFNASELDEQKIVYYMTGKTFEQKVKRETKKFGKKLLEIKDLCKKKNYMNINLELREGEILGIIGLIGSGRTELALSIFGMNPPDSGEIFLLGERVNFNSNYQAINSGIAYVPEDRLNDGLFLDQPISTNIIASIMDRLVNKAKIFLEYKIKKVVNKWVHDLEIKTDDPEKPVITLSGGNQQKTVIAKWLAATPKVLILDNPTVGVDIASKHGIYNIIKELANKKLGIILISDEVPEVYYNADRILIMKKGRIINEVFPDKITEAELQEMVIGGEINV